MQQKNKIMKHWSTVVGEFYNPDHDQIKKKLLTFFKDYKKSTLHLEKEEKILIYTKVVMIYIKKTTKICKKFCNSFQSVFFLLIKKQAKPIYQREVETKNIVLKLEHLGLLPTKAVVSFHHTLMIIVVGLVYIMFNHEKILIKKMEPLICRHHIPD